MHTYVTDPSKKYYLIDGLKEEWIIEQHYSHEQICTILDTYDQTLLRQKKIALICGESYSFFNLLDARKDVLRSVSRSLFDYDTQPEEIVKSRSGWRVGIRTEARYTEEYFLVRNTDRKGVARLSFLSITADYPPPLNIMRVKLVPLRGYDEEAENIRTILEHLVPEAGIRFPLDEQIEIKPQMPYEDGIRMFCIHLLKRARTFEKGCIDDTDPECLHQYRVNFRRIRALLGLAKSIFFRDWLQPLTDELSEIMKRTNRLRDLDVHIDAMKLYRQSLPDTLKPGAFLLEEKLVHERRKEQGKVAAFLASEKYLRRMRQLEENLDNHPESQKTEGPSIPLQAAVLNVLDRRFKKIVKMIRELDPDAEDLHFHRIRIEGKKLRYTLEFLEDFSDLKQVKKIIKKMKRFQDLFGTYNDLSVQEEFLHTYMDGVENDGPLKDNSRRIEMAVGGILTIISEKKNEIQKMMMEEIASVRDKNLKKNISRLVKEGTDEVSRPL